MTLFALDLEPTIQPPSDFMNAMDGNVSRCRWRRHRKRYTDTTSAVQLGRCGPSPSNSTLLTILIKHTWLHIERNEHVHTDTCISLTDSGFHRTNVPEERAGSSRTPRRTAGYDHLKFSHDNTLRLTF